MRTRRRVRLRRAALHARRGSALILVLMMTLAVAGLSVAAIFMSSSAGLLSAYYDRERDYRLAADAALEIARTRLRRDTALVIPDTGMTVLLSGYQVRDAQGVVLPRVRVNLFAATTGDTLGGALPTVTLIAQAYDAGGTRQVRRMDLRRESFSRYALFVDSFPSGESHGPGFVPGRVHTNGTWRSSGSGNTYRDSVSAVAGFAGTASFLGDTASAVPRIRFPKDSAFPELNTLAAAANLSFAPVSGTGRGTRLEFVAFDANNDGAIGQAEGFARIFDLANVVGIDTNRLRAADTIRNPTWIPSYKYYRWNSPEVQRQCGAFYRRGTRWHFFPVATHRSAWTQAVIQQSGANDFPAVDAATYTTMRAYTATAVVTILGNQTTARCFPAGSPYLLTTERMTNTAGVITGTAADTVPFGVVVPPGGWPASAPSGYGGTDTTFTPRSRTCSFSTTNTLGRCDTGTITDLGTWRTFAGAAVSGVPTTVRQAAELPYLWPYGATYNAASRGVISATAGPLFVSGDVRGRVTLRVAGRVEVVDRLRYALDPSDPSRAPCDDQFGLVAQGDILVVDGLTSRVRRISDEIVAFGIVWPGLNVLVTPTGGQTRFALQGSYLSTGGTVGVQNPGGTMGFSFDQLPCPDDGSGASNSNGGCLAVVGGLTMRRYTGLYSGSDAGFRYSGAPDRCQATTRRPPFFPLTNRVTFVRTLEVDPTLANTPTRIRAILMRLKGKAL
ncbi:MAG: pilus assembly PilX N-terminal domain-containing protein [Gemmatimonadota bacterium]|nr:pilus assembly PilX N-terminal domain-containing protein [Gemmatimonadota bacterium]